MRRTSGGGREGVDSSVLESIHPSVVDTVDEGDDDDDDDTIVADKCFLRAVLFWPSDSSVVRTHDGRMCRRGEACGGGRGGGGGEGNDLCKSRTHRDCFEASFVSPEHFSFFVAFFSRKNHA